MEVDCEEVKSSTTRRPTVLHPILVVIADWWVLMVGVGFLLAIVTAVTGEPLSPRFAVVVGPGTLLASLAYRVRISKQTRRRSYGERLMGVTNSPQGKAWSNPFGRNRWALILVWFVTLGWDANRWDAIYTRSYSVGSLVIGPMLTLFIFWSVLRWGAARASGGWCVLSYQALVAMSLFSLVAPSGPESKTGGHSEILRMMALGAGSLAAITLVLLIIYGRGERKTLPD